MGQNDADIQKNSAYFKSKLPPLSQTDNELFDKLDKECETEYLELLGKKKKVIPLSLNSNFPKHEGYYYPVRINDSYGLLLNCSLLENQKTNDLTWLNSLQKLVAESVSNQKGTLGETWFFSAQLENLEQSEELATKIYQTLIPDANATENKVGKSDFFNGEIFEFAKFYEDKHNVIITFYKEKSNLDNENKFFKDWMRLLFYRHKITWAYNQSRQLINYIRASVAIREETRDRELLHTATFLGVGLAVGAIVSSVIEQAPLIEAAEGWSKFGLSLGISIGLAILAGFVVWWKQNK